MRNLQKHMMTCVKFILYLFAQLIFQLRLSDHTSCSCGIVVVVGIVVIVGVVVVIGIVC